MALLQTDLFLCKEPCHWTPNFLLRKEGRFPFFERRTCSLTLRYGPLLTVSCSNSSSLKGFQRIWASRVSPAFSAMVALAVTFSQAACALGSFLHLKSMPRKLYLPIPGESTIITEKGSKTAQKIFESLQRLQNRDKSRAYNSFLEQGGLGMALLSTTAMAKDRISPVIATLCANPTFMSGLVAWTLAQALKVFTTFFVEKRWDFKMLLGSGGMPSSHSALCVALTTSVAVCHGLSDALFPVCLGFSLIVMYDATGVRRHAGMQAEVLNLIVEDLFKGHPVSEKKLKELLGHTPLQVGAGAMVGMLAGYFCSQGYSVFPGHGI